MGFLNTLTQRYNTFLTKRRTSRYTKRLIKKTEKDIQLLELTIEKTPSNISIEEAIETIRHFQDSQFLFSIDFTLPHELSQLVNANRDLTAEEKSKVIELYHTLRQDLLTLLLKDARKRVESQTVTHLWYEDFERNVLIISFRFFIMERVKEGQRNMAERERERLSKMRDHKNRDITKTL